MIVHHIIQWLRQAGWVSQLQTSHQAVLSNWLRHYGAKTVMVSSNSAMIFAPHQDDETFGCGGLIALKGQQAAQVNVVFLSDGAATVTQDADVATLIQIRQQEALTALSILGVQADHVHFLSYPDGHLSNLNEQQYQAAIADLLEMLERYRPKEVYLPHAKDHHPDHEATFRIVKAALAQWSTPVECFQYPVWMFWGSPFLFKLKVRDLIPAYCIAIDEVQWQKQKAIAAYQSQHPHLPQQFLKQFHKPFELFFKL